jgi:hypothetical protein
MTAESMNDVTSIRGTARKLPDVLPPLSPLSTERTTAAWGVPTLPYIMLGMRGVGQKTPCPHAVCTSRLKTSRLTTNSTLIGGLRFRARFGTKIGLLVMCADTGRILLVILFPRDTAAVTVLDSRDF